MSAPVRLLLSLFLAVSTLVAAPDSQARTFETLYRFTGGADGAFPVGDLVLNGGALYGTAYGGGAHRRGTVFKFDLTTRVLTTLYSFTGGADGAIPLGGVVLDATGALYGTTAEGGLTATFRCSTIGCGTVFRLDPSTGTLTTLHAFRGDAADGGFPRAGLVLRNGVLYGTSGGSGAFTQGTVFALDPITQTLATLHSFCSLGNYCADGSGPGGRLAFDAAGTLYGTTSEGGGKGACLITGFCGTAFEIDPATRALTTLHRFAGLARGGDPEGSLVFWDGFLLGTTALNEKLGNIGHGVVFRLNPVTRASSPVHTFTGADGSYPLAGLTLRGDEVYGTTYYGGRAGKGCINDGCGTVFRLGLKTKTLTTLHAFTGSDGDNPWSGLVFDTTGTLYGATLGGGLFRAACTTGNTDGCGTLFELTP